MRRRQPVRLKLYHDPLWAFHGPVTLVQFPTRGIVSKLSYGILSRENYLRYVGG
jgi:hypothetical protein